MVRGVGSEGVVKGWGGGRDGDRRLRQRGEWREGGSERSRREGRKGGGSGEG